MLKRKSFISLLLILSVMFSLSAYGAGEKISDKEFLNLCQGSSAQKIIAAIDNGANVNAKDNKGRTALMAAAARNKNPEVVNALLRTGADVNAKNDGSWTALMYAVYNNNNYKIVNALLKAGADVKNKDNDGKTALDYARENEKLKDTNALKRLEELSK